MRFAFCFMQLIISLLGAAALFGSMLSMWLFGVEIPLFWQFWIALVVQVFGGFQLYQKSFNALRYKILHADLLIALGTTIVFVYSSLVWLLGLRDHVYFETGAVILAFVLLGRYFEERAKRRERLGMENLILMQPKKAWVMRDCEEKEVSIHELSIGDTVLVKKGEQIPVDGKILRGQSFVNEAIMTGESDYVSKKEGDTVLGGTVNMESPIYVLSERMGEETALGRMIQLVEKAENTKLPLEKIIDKIAAIFVPLVIGISLITFAMWLFLSGSLTMAIKSMVAVLVISCPSALVLAIPVVIMVSIHRAAKKGILIKDFQSLEIVGKTKHMVLDKTVFLARKEAFVGAFLFEDPIMQDARVIIQRLKELKIVTHLVSGDRPEVVKRVAEVIQVDHYRSSVSPGQEGEYLQTLKGITCMVGDGVNDAPALATATIGIAMSLRTDVAMEAASIGIMGKKLSLLPHLIEFSKKTRIRLWQNILYAFGYNIIAIPLAAMGYLNPMIAGAIMALSSFSLVMNAMRK